MKSVDRGILAKSVCFPLTPSETTKKLFYYPTWCGHYYCTSEYFMKRDYYPPLLILFVREGVLNVEYRGEKRKVKKGEIILLDCSEPHYYHAEDGLEFLYMHFDGLNSHEICRHITDLHGWLMCRDNNMLIGQLLYEMVDFYDQNGLETNFESSERIYRLFGLLLAPTKQEKEENSPIDDAVLYIRSNVGKEITLKELARIANLSPSHFSRCFKRQTGFSPIEYIINTRIERAKTLLVRTHQTVAEIAYEVGYSSSSSLINLFLKQVDESPKQYRYSHQSSQ